MKPYLSVVVPAYKQSLQAGNRRIYLSVVIPAYNEEHNLRTGVLASVYEYLSKQKYSWEIIFVDDGSTDRTLDLAKDFAKLRKNFRVLAEPHRGKGGAVISGVLSAKGEVVLFTDTDQATPIDQVEKMLPKFTRGVDMVIGSRSGREGAPLIRKAMAYGFSLLRLMILNLPFKDTQCGFKAFKKDAAKKIFSKLLIFDNSRRDEGASVSAGFDLEMIYVAKKMGYKIAEVPVDWHHKEGTRVNPIKDSLEGLKDLLSVRINAFLGKYPI